MITSLCHSKENELFKNLFFIILLNFRKLRGVQKLQKFRSSDITTTNDH